MLTKNVHIFDTASKPLAVDGIRVELFDSKNGTLLDTKNTQQLELERWGVKLKFKPSPNPLDIYFADPSFIYPGNMLRSLNGKLDDQVNIDLYKQPPGPGGNGVYSGKSPSDLTTWVNNSPQWTPDEKLAVINLALNYTIVFSATRRFQNVAELERVLRNWREALERRGVSIAILITGKL